jgi:hypothetical protein
MPFPVRSFTGPCTGTGLYARGPISGTGLCQFWYGRSLGPVPELDSMRVVPFLVPGSASSGDGRPGAGAVGLAEVESWDGSVDTGKHRHSASTMRSAFK